jgi:hypothetical protein
MSNQRRIFFSIWLSTTLLCISSCTMLRMSPRNYGDGYQQTRLMPIQWRRIKGDFLGKDLTPEESKRLVLQIDRLGLEFTSEESS